MRRILVSLLFLALIVMLALPVQAQTPAPTDKCTADSLTALSGDLAQANKDAQDAITKGDLAGAMDALTRNETALQTMQAECAGLSFSGKKGKVLGPLNIDSGTYVATLTTAGYAAVKVTATDGKCGAGSGVFLNPLLFNLVKGDAAEGAQAVFSSESCTALLEVSNVQSDWTLTLMKAG